MGQIKNLPIIWKHSFVLLFLTLLPRNSLGSTVASVSNDPDRVNNYMAGNIYGGTKLWVRGTGFDATPGNNEIFVGTNLCPTIDAESTTELLVCRMQKLKYYEEGVNEIGVRTNNQVANYLNGPYEITLQPDTSALLTAVIPSTIYPGQPLHFLGYFLVDLVSEISLVKVHSYHCTPNPSDASLDSLVDSAFSCDVTEEIPIGQYEAEVLSSDSAGYAQPKVDSINYPLSSPFEKYMIRVHPAIFSMSQNSGYITGSFIQIYGIGFGDDDEVVEVSLNGRECSIFEIENDEIQCNLARAPSRFTEAVFKGGRGLRWQSYDASFGETMFDLYNEFSVYHEEILFSTENKFMGGNTIDRMYGIFTSQGAGNYRFHISGDYHGSIKISSSPVDYNTEFDPDMLTEICSYKEETSFREFNKGQGQDCSVTLEANSDYYFFVTYKDKDSEGYFTVGMSMPNSDATAPDTQKRIQRVTIANSHTPIIYKMNFINYTSGFYDITFENGSGQTKTASDIDLLFECPELVSALEELLGGDIDCTLTSDALNRLYVLTFNTFVEYGEMISVTNSSLNGSGRKFDVISQQQSTELSGSFDLVYGTSAPINVSTTTTSEQLKRGLELILELREGVSVFEEGTVESGKSWCISVDSLDPGAEKDFSVTNVQLFGGNQATVQVDTNWVAASSRRVFTPIPSEFLSTFHEKPQISVKVSGVLAGCIGAECNFEYVFGANIPGITSYSRNNEELTVTLDPNYLELEFSGAPLSSEDFSINFANSECFVTEVSLPEIKCTVPLNPDGTPELEAGNHVPEVLVLGRGKLRSNQLTPEFIPMTITDIDPKSGSFEGGTFVTITGKGFPIEDSIYGSSGEYRMNDNSLKLCEPIFESNTEVICRMADKKTHNFNINTFRLKLHVNDHPGVWTNSYFRFMNNKTPEFNKMTPNVSSPIDKTQVEITGYDFQDSKDKMVVTLISETDPVNYFTCTVLESSQTNLVFEVPGGPIDTYRVLLYHDNWGFSTIDPKDVDLYTIGYTLGGVSPSAGSKEGGTELTISGTGFSLQMDKTEVLIGELNNGKCLVTSVTNTQIKCITQKPFFELDGAYPIYLQLNKEFSRTCDNCEFSLLESFTPHIQGISPSSASLGDTVTVSGVNLDGDSLSALTLTIGNVNVTDPVLISPTAISFKIPEIASGTYVPEMTMFNKGHARVDISVQVTVIPSLVSVSPSIGSKFGGLITLTGTNLPSDIASIMVGSATCNVQNVTVTQITCLLGQLTEVNTPLDVVITYNKPDKTTETLTCATCTYTAEDNTPSVGSIEVDDPVDSDDVDISIGGDNIPSTGGSTDTPREEDDFTGLLTISEPEIYGDVTQDLDVTLNPPEVDLNIKNAIAGIYDVVVNIDGIGAVGFEDPNESRITIVPEISSIPTITSPFTGGSELIINGKGFPPLDNSKLAEVRVCGKVCQITNSTYNQITCDTPIINNATLQSKYSIVIPSLQKNIILRGGSGAGEIFKVFDEDDQTVFCDPELILDYGAETRVRVMQVELMVRLNPGQTVYAGQISGSNDKVNYTLMGKFGTGFIGEPNVVVVPDNTDWDYRYLKFENTSDDYCVTQMNVTGLDFLNVDPITLLSYMCDVTLNVGGVSAPLQSSIVDYQMDLPSEATSLSPVNGPVSGGTLLTINGTAFPNDVEVTIDGVPCVIVSVSETQIYCTTGAKTTDAEPSFTITSPTKGEVLTNGLTFSYIQRWSEPDTWAPGSAPGTGDDLIVPEGTIILVDENPPVLGDVIVRGNLIFADEGPIDFEADFIHVDGGTLGAGTEDEPHESPLTITLNGDPKTEGVPGLGNGGIMVNNGSINLHGSETEHPKAFLEESAMAGDNTLTMADDVDWEAGNVIVITSTSKNRSQTETHTVDSVAGNVVTLRDTLAFPHFAGEITVPTNDASDQAFNLNAEVGLLTRNIVLKGPDTADTTGNGVFILVKTTGDTTEAKISNIEITKAGQRVYNGKYPVHFDTLGDTTGNYVKSVSIHGSSNRGIGINATNGVEILNNVIYDVEGHAIYVPNGIEQNNTFSENLVTNVKAGTQTSEDSTPAAIYLTRVKNTVVTNSFVASEGPGIWLDLKSTPSSFYQSLTICPDGEVTSDVMMNLSHGNAVGFKVSGRYRPRTDPCDIAENELLLDLFSENPSIQSDFSQNFFYMNELAVEWDRVGAVSLKEALMISNELHLLVKETSGADDLSSKIEDSILIGDSEIFDFHYGSIKNESRAIEVGCHDGFFVNNVRLYNFSGSELFTFCDDNTEGVSKHAPGSRTSFTDLEIKNSTATLIDFTVKTSESIIRDYSGSFVDKMDLPASIAANYSTGGWVAPWSEHLDIPECHKVQDTSKCSIDCVVCTPDISVLRLLIRIKDTGFDMENTPLKLSNSSIGTTDAQSSMVDSLNIEGQDFWIPIIATGHNYEFAYNDTVDSYEFEIQNDRYWNSLDSSDFLLLKHKPVTLKEEYTTKFSGFDGTNDLEYDVDVPMKSSDPLTLTATDKFGDFLYIRKDNNIDWVLDGERIGLILTTGVELVDTPKLWSLTTTWPNGKVPEDGDDVTVPKGNEIILDVPTADLGNLTVEGTLTVDPEAAEDLEITADLIHVAPTGSINAGTEDEPLTNNFTITLTGAENDNTTSVGPNNDPVNKALIIEGEVHLHGTPPDHPVLPSIVSVEPGTDSIFLEERQHGWKAGDQIVISSSFMDPGKYDLLTIISVNSSTGEITFDSSFDYYHFGDSMVISTEQGDLDVRARVGNLTRNIKIQGGDDASWGCTILVTDNSDLSDTMQGTINFDGVEIKNCGQITGEQAALQFAHLSSDMSQQSVTNSTFNMSQGIAVKVLEAGGITFSDNLLFSSRKVGILLEDANVTTIENNQIILVYWSSLDDDYITKGIQVRGNMPLSPDDITIASNRVSSVSSMGFYLPGRECDEGDSNVDNGNTDFSGLNFYNNVAHSNKIGWFASENEMENCLKYSHFKAYKNSHQGFLHRIGADQVVVEEMVLADNGTAIIVNTSKKTETEYPIIMIRDSVIIGKSLFDITDLYAQAEDCLTNGIQTGFFASETYMLDDTLMEMPLEDPTSPKSLYGGKQYIENVNFKSFTFFGFCSDQSFMLKINDKYQEASNAIYLKNIMLEDVDEANMIHYPELMKMGESGEYCNENTCTGVYNTPIFDPEGTLLGTPAHIFGNLPGAVIGDNCDFKIEWNGHLCQTNYAQLLISRDPISLDPAGMQLTMEISPLNEFERILQSSFVNETNGEVNSVNIVREEEVTALSFTNDVPFYLNFQLFSDMEDQSSWAVFKLTSDKLAALRVYPHGSNSMIDPILLNVTAGMDPASNSSDCGAHYIDADNNAVYFIINGDPDCRVSLKFVDVVKLMVKLDVEMELYGNSEAIEEAKQNIATLLGIPSSLVRALTLNEKEKMVIFEIESTKTADVDFEDLSAIEEKFQGMTDKLEAALNDESLDLRAKCLDFAIFQLIYGSDLKDPVVPEEPKDKPDEPDDPPADDEPVDPPKEPMEFTSTDILYIFIGMIVLFLSLSILLAVLVYVCKYATAPAEEEYSENFINTETAGTMQSIYAEDERRRYTRETLRRPSRREFISYANNY